jgi:carboxyl-terminal processing protease
VADAEQEIGPRLSGLIIDLRDNPGGLLNQSVAVSNLFLTEGRVVSTHGRHPDSHQYFEASGEDITNGKPIVVLVDGNSASAAEIVAAALQDNRRAVVVGCNTYGKGTVQTVLPLPNQGEITLTWVRFHAPSGYTLHHLGVLPSICTSTYRSADEVMQDLTAGRLPMVPTDRRNVVKPDDTKGLEALRKTCPHSRRPDRPEAAAPGPRRRCSRAPTWPSRRSWARTAKRRRGRAAPDAMTARSRRSMRLA